MRVIQTILTYVVLSVSFLVGVYTTTTLTTQAKVTNQVQSRIIPIANQLKDTPVFSLPNAVETEDLATYNLLLASKQTKAAQNEKKIVATTILTQPQPLTEPGYTNQILYNNVGLNVPFLHSTLSDFYEVENGIVNYLKPKSTSDTSSNIQKLMNKGPVHVAFTPSPGSIGNAYFVAHNFLHFSPIQEKGTVGDIVTVINNGKELTFKIFETRYINKYDTSTAYYGYPGKTMITLQTCTSNPDSMWIIRAELI
jgi:Sortase domain